MSYQNTDLGGETRLTIGYAQRLRLATWNCGGLSYTQRELCDELGYDVLALTETHDTGRLPPNRRFVVAESASEGDSASGVALLLSERIVACATHTGCVGSRIVYVRLRAAASNLFIVGVYVPHDQRQHPSRADTFAELEALLERVPRGDCLLVMGDFNCRLPRSHGKRTGRWCIHPRANVSGLELLKMMERLDLTAASTRFQPRRNHTNATYMPKDPRYTPLQLDYILTSSRWGSSVRQSHVRWGVSIRRWGRRYDHGLVECTWQVRLAIKRRMPPMPDYTTLKRDDGVAEAYDAAVRRGLAEVTVEDGDVGKRLERLRNVTTQAASKLPVVRHQRLRKRMISQRTKQLYEERVRCYHQLTPDERKRRGKEIGRACRDDYRCYIDDQLGDIEIANRVGNVREVARLTKALSGRGKRGGNVMPTKAADGKPLTEVQQLLDAWQDFLGRKFECADVPGAAYAPDIAGDENDADEVTTQELETCLRVLRNGKAPGWDGIPVEAYRGSPAAKAELFAIVQRIWRHEDIPPDLVRGIFVMLHKKGSRDNFCNYRAIGLLCHSYKLLSMVVLHRMQDAVELRLAETQAGFRRARGCRDNVLLLRLLMDAVLRAGEEAVVTFIDYRAAFDTISHRFMDESMAAAGVSPKVRRIVKAIYAGATGVIRLRLPSGETMSSESFPIRRGVIQGDIFSPQCFTLGLDRIFRLHDIAGQSIGGPSLGDVTASKLEYADDVALLDCTVIEASKRVSALATGSRMSASMEMSAPKSKGMRVRAREPLTVSTEAEVEALRLPHSCPDCERSFPTTRGLAIHRARWCRPGQPPASRRGQLADKAVKLAKRKASAALLQPVTLEGEPLEMVYQFEYLGCRFTSDGDDTADMLHRMAIAGERFRSLSHIWRDNRLPRLLKLRIYAACVCSTLTHGSEAWSLTPKALKSLNGLNSRQLHIITGRSHRDEATMPSYDLLLAVRKRRHQWLGHILRMPPDRLVHRAVLALGRRGGPPYQPGSLLMDAEIPMDQLALLATDRSSWARDGRSLSSLQESP